jgi:hypothetical protein
MSKRNPDAQNRLIRQLIYVRDKERCRWCHEPVPFKDGMIVAHGIAFAQAPQLDHIGNWFTCCSDCNSVGKWSAPPRPPPLEEASVPQLQETNAQLQLMGEQLQAMGEGLQELGAKLGEFVDYSRPQQEEPAKFDPELCQAKGAPCAQVGCQVPSCANFTHFGYGQGGGVVVSEYDPMKQSW